MLTTTKTQQVEELQQAFEVFSRVSTDLVQTYQAFERRIDDLTGQLHSVHASRQQEQAEKECIAEQLQSLLCMLPAAVVILDSKGIVRQSNSMAEDFLGTPLLNESWLAISNRAFEPRSDDGYEVSLKDGRRLSIATKALEHEPGQLLLFTDLTETRALQARVSRHERLSAMGKMVASIAHQVRTPLSTALIYAANLQNTQLPAEKQQQFTNKLVDSLHHLERQVKDMLLYVRGGSTLKSEYSIEQLVEDLQCVCLDAFMRAGSVLQVNNEVGNINLYCNADAIVGALHNLLDNAIHAAGKQAVVQLIIRQTNPAFIDFIVKDNGPGIPESIQQQVLEPFFTTRNQGTGLGLAIAQVVAKSHYGSVWLNSPETGGAEVALRIPIKPTPQARDEESQS